MLDAEPAIDWVRMVLPNLHHWRVDLEPFGLENPNEIFVSTTEPHGLIEATVRRRRGAPGRAALSRAARSP
jgi:urate oxidase